MAVSWLDDAERQAWVRLVSVVQLLPGVLEAQLRQDAGITHFEYWVLSMLSEAPARTLRMTALADRTNATLSRLSHVVNRLEGRGLVTRVQCPHDRRAFEAHLTDAGWDTVVAAAPGHVETVRSHVVDVLSRDQLAALAEISEAILERVDPSGAVRRLTEPAPGDHPGRDDEPTPSGGTGPAG